MMNWDDRRTGERIVIAKDRLNTLRVDLAKHQAEAKSIAEEIQATTTAVWMVGEMARVTRQRTKDVIEDLVTSAISSVYVNRVFRFILDFKTTASGRSECRPLVIEGEDDDPFDPEDEMGGSMMDVISFALRVVMWHVKSPRTRNTILLDEPFKFVGHGIKAQRCAKLLQTVSHRLGIQFIVFTHETQIADCADTIHNVIHNGRYSTVTRTLGPEPAKKPLKRVRS